MEWPINDNLAEKKDSPVEKLDNFLTQELDFMPGELPKGPQKLRLYMNYTASPATLDGWHRLAYSDNAEASDRDILDVSELSMAQLQSLYKYLIRLLPHELQRETLTALNKDLKCNDAFDDPEALLDEVGDDEQVMRTVVQYLLARAKRREVIMKADAGTKPLISNRIGFHSSDALVGNNVETRNRGAEAYHDQEGFSDKTGEKYVSIAPDDVYPGRYLYIVEIPVGSEPVPGRVTWLKSHAALPIRLRVECTPEVMDTFGIKRGNVH